MQTADSRPTSQRLAVTAAVVLAFAIPAAALIASGIERTPSSADQAEYHVPTIRQFASQWPAIDFKSYPAAMTPGYHLLMMAVWKIGDSVQAMQWATLLITAGLIGTLAGAVTGRSRLAAIDVILLCLPFAWSQYVLVPGVYVSPHNLAWWCLLLILLIAVDRTWSVRWAVVSGALLTATVFVRQIFLWAAAPLVVAAMTSNVKASPGRNWFVRALVTGVCCLPAVALLYYFYKLWGSLAPSSQPWAKPADGVNTAAAVMTFATFGLLAPLSIARLPAGRSQWFAVAFGLVVGLVLALSTPTTYNFDAGRWSGLWNFAGIAGSVSGRSVLMTVLSAVGGGCIGLLLTLSGRHWPVWSTVAAVFIAANAAVNQSWQRYYEPMVLMMCVLIMRDQKAANGKERVARGALCIAQAALTAWAFRSG